MAQKQRLLLKISIALFVLDGCSKQDAANIEFTDRMFQLHYVKSGETVESIAKAYSMSKEDLIKINQLKSPFKLAVKQRLHVHKKFFSTRDEVTEEKEVPEHVEKVRKNLIIRDPEIRSKPTFSRTGVMPKTSPVVVRHTGLGKVLLPIGALAATAAALKPGVSLAAPNVGSGTGNSSSAFSPAVQFPSRSRRSSVPAIPSGTDSSGNNTADDIAPDNDNSPPNKPQQPNPSNSTSSNLPNISGVIPAGSTSGSSNTLKGTPVFAALTASVPVLGAAGLLASGLKGGGIGGAIMSSKDPRLKTFGCDARPCFVWPIGNKERKFVHTNLKKETPAKKGGIYILNSRGERFVRPANHGIIEKVIRPQNTGNRQLFTVVINHSYGQCKSGYKTVYADLTKISKWLEPGYFVGRDVIIGEIKPCCNTKMFFQILDGDIPVKDTLRFLPNA